MRQKLLTKFANNEVQESKKKKLHYCNHNDDDTRCYEFS